MLHSYIQNSVTWACGACCRAASVLPPWNRIRRREESWARSVRVETTAASTSSAKSNSQKKLSASITTQRVVHTLRALTATFVQNRVVGNLIPRTNTSQKTRHRGCCAYLPKAGFPFKRFRCDSAKRFRKRKTAFPLQRFSQAISGISQRAWRHIKGFSTILPLTDTVLVVAWYVSCMIYTSAAWYVAQSFHGKGANWGVK